MSVETVQSIGAEHRVFLASYVSASHEFRGGGALIGRNLGVESNGRIDTVAEAGLAL